MKKNTLLLWGLILVLAFFVFFLLVKNYTLKKNTGSFTREIGGSYTFTNPILDFELSQEFSNSIISSSSARTFIENIKKDSNIGHISVYFRDLNNGPWIGVEEKEYFSPASMLKTPLLISLFKWAEKDPSVFEKKIVAEDRFFIDVLPQHNSVYSVVKNQKYTLLELATKMIQESDNVAVNILYEEIPQNYIDDLYMNIGVPIIEEDKDILIRIKDMGAFYRVLFNASYLNREDSETVLSILSNTNYTSGLVAGVPEGMEVSHKFGERFSSGVLLNTGLIPKGDIQLHDCGIVYKPKKPYILCVMTRGTDFKKQEQAIATISKFFYEKVSQ